MKDTIAHKNVDIERAYREYREFVKRVNEAEKEVQTLPADQECHKRVVFSMEFGANILQNLMFASGGLE